MSAPNEAATPWRRASLAAALFAIDPVGNGVIVRAGPGPVRDAWLGLLVEALPAGAQSIWIAAAAARIIKGGPPVAGEGLLWMNVITRYWFLISVSDLL